MNKLFQCAAPVVLAASLFCSAAHAAQQDSAGAQPQVTLTHQAPADLAIQLPHRLTRKQVYDQLVREENDGTLARVNALYEGS